MMAQVIGFRGLGEPPAGGAILYKKSVAAESETAANQRTNNNIAEEVHAEQYSRDRNTQRTKQQCRQERRIELAQSNRDGKCRDGVT